MTDPKHARTQDEHSPTPWRQGVTLLTRRTAQWSNEEIAANNAVEGLLVFSRFIGDDEGRGRGLVAKCERVEDVAHIVHCVNAHDALVEALEFALEQQSAVEQMRPEGYGTPRATIDWMDQARAALDAAKGAKR